MRDVAALYAEWLEKAVADPDLIPELKQMKADSARLEDAFYRDLEFGTAGLRGVIGAGSNRMNVYTVGRTSQGLSQYIQKRFPPVQWKIAVSYDSRIKSRLFAETAARVFAANGIHVVMYAQLMPVPCLSFAVRNLCCGAGIMITASHNPAQYNGYKVYGPDGCQITSEGTTEILAAIEALDPFADVKYIDFEEGLERGLISYIPEAVYTAFIEAVKMQSVLGKAAIDKDVSIVYSPLNGTGLKPVLRILSESGYTKVRVVREQEQPDGTFPTCPCPNPEIREAMALGMEYAEKYRADLLLATDPDCDRVGIAVKNSAGEYELISGNETGMLLVDYLCSRRQAEGTLPEDPLVIKTIVTTDMVEQIAAHYGVKTCNVLTGFKYIGEQIRLLEEQGKAASYVFGFEESYGYLAGTHVRDKDAVVASFLICEMFCYYKAQGMSLLDKLAELYRTYGYCLNTLYSYTFAGASGFERMQTIMEDFRRRGGALAPGGKRVLKVLDYAAGLEGLPPADVVKFVLEDHGSVVIRPSGTEPKLKTYITVSAADKDNALVVEQCIKADLEKLIYEK